MKGCARLLASGFALVVFFAGGATAGTTRPHGTAGDAALAHEVFGSGKVVEGDVTFTTSVAVAETSTGALRGFEVTWVDLRADGLGLIWFNEKPTCLSVSGNAVWIGAVITQTSNPDVFPVGTNTITLVRDLGGWGKDVMHQETEDDFPPGTVCTDQPELNQTVVKPGDYQLR